MEEASLEDVLDSIKIMGVSLYSLTEASWRNIVEYYWSDAIFVMCLVAFWFFFKARFDKSSSSATLTFVIFRNLILFIVLNAMVRYIELATGGIACQKELLSSDPSYSLASSNKIFPPSWKQEPQVIMLEVADFFARWRQFHPPHLWLLRWSHALLYPMILLCLTRRKLSEFVAWLAFIVILDLGDAAAGGMHIISDPELAEERLTYKGQTMRCYVVSSVLFSALLPYPLNFVYLSTPLGNQA